MGKLKQHLVRYNRWTEEINQLWKHLFSLFEKQSFDSKLNGEDFFKVQCVYELFFH